MQCQPLRFSTEHRISSIRVVREFGKLRRQLQRKRDFKIEHWGRLGILRLFHLGYVVRERVRSHDVTEAMLEELAKKRRPSWRSEISFWGLNCILMQIPPFVSLCKYGFLSHERTHSIGEMSLGLLGTNYFHVQAENERFTAASEPQI